MSDAPLRQQHLDAFFKAGKTMIVPIDHGTAIPVPGLESPGELIRALNPFADGYVLNFGLARAWGDAIGDRAICFRTDVYKPAAHDPGSYRVWAADDALEVGADAVMNMCYPHHPAEEKIIHECATLISECIDIELPVILESLPYGIGRPEDYTLDNIAFAVRLAAELGADVVKTAFPTGASVDEFAAVIDTCFVPVVVLGGAAMGDDRALLEMVRNAMDAGASGIAVGRNVWQHPQPAVIARSLHAVVHGDASVDEALALMGDD